MSGRYNVWGGGYYYDSLKDIRKIAYKEALYDYNHGLNDGPIKILDTHAGKFIEEVWFNINKGMLLAKLPSKKATHILSESGAIRKI